MDLLVCRGGDSKELDDDGPAGGGSVAEGPEDGPAGAVDVIIASPLLLLLLGPAVLPLNNKSLRVVYCTRNA